MLERALALVAGGPNQWILDQETVRITGERSEADC